MTNSLEDLMETESSFAVDYEKLLAPISTDSPAGELLRYEGTYDRINEARRQDESNLAQGIWERDLKDADWTRVSEICLESLEKRSKDLQIAAWLLESWLHLHGFLGVREGLRATEELCRAFWDTMHPSEEDPEYRLSIFQWINEKLSIKLKFIPITHPPLASNSIPYRYGDWEFACRAEQEIRQHPELKKDRSVADKTEITVAMFQQSAALSPASFIEPLRADLASANNACVELEAFLDDEYGKNGPSLRGFRTILESIQSLVHQNSGVRKIAPATQPAAVAEEVSGLDLAIQNYATVIQTAPPGAPIQSRAEAYQRLAEAADYLVKTEPHSPAPYLVRKAISWGNMTLDELLPELVLNEGALQETMRLLQIESRKESTTQTKK